MRALAIRPAWTSLCAIRVIMPRVTEEALGPIATELVYEDDHVRVWTHHLEPGEASPLHRHDHDFGIELP